ncbi:MAG: hypothetical protein EBU90_01400 [Proteobacteria bacterium]|nr:hypothetical protein [Pseudomonadota bacterium]
MVLNKVEIIKGETCLTYAFRRSAIAQKKFSKELANNLVLLNNLQYVQKEIDSEKSRYLYPEGYVAKTSDLKIGDVVMLDNKYPQRELVASCIDEFGKIHHSYCTGGFHTVVIEKIEDDNSLVFSGLTNIDFRPTIRFIKSEVLFEMFNYGNDKVLLKFLT